jgi:peptide/nickel transport system substrate-binding protein
MIPAIAKRWEISDDGRVWTFYLRNDVLFHNKKKLTSQDVVATYQAVKLNPYASLFSELSNLERVESVDEHTVRFILSRFDSFFPGYFPYIRIVPQEILKNGIIGTKDVGTGPYRLKMFSSEEIQLDAFPEHFRGKSFLNGIVVKILKSERACIAQLISGDVDLVFHEDVSDMQIVSSVPGIREFNIGNSIAYVLILNHDSPFISDPEIRSAISYAFDYEAMNRSLLRGLDVNRQVSQSEQSALRLEYLRSAYDPKKAVSLLKSAGLVNSNDDCFVDKKGKRFEFEISIVKGWPFFRKMFKQIKSFLEDVGISVNLKEYEMKDFVKKLFVDKDYDAAMIPIQTRELLLLKYSFWHSKGGQGNFLNYSNTEVDRLLDVIRYNRDDIAKEGAKQDLIRVLREDPPLIPLFILKYSVLVNDRFQGFTPDALLFFSNLRNVWVPKERQLRTSRSP